MCTSSGVLCAQCIAMPRRRSHLHWSWFMIYKWRWFHEDSCAGCGCVEAFLFVVQTQLYLCIKNEYYQHSWHMLAISWGLNLGVIRTFQVRGANLSHAANWVLYHMWELISVPPCALRYNRGTESVWLAATLHRNSEIHCWALKDNHGLALLAIACFICVTPTSVIALSWFSPSLVKNLRLQLGKETFSSCFVPLAEHSVSKRTQLKCLTLQQE